MMTDSTSTTLRGVEVSKTDSNLIKFRSRTQELRARLSELLKSVLMLRDGVGSGRKASWASFLSKYDTLAKLYAQLTKELDRAVVEGLNNFLLEPRALAQDPGIVPELLRTKLQPEMENEVAELEEECRLDMGGMEPTPQMLDARVRDFNAFVEAALKRYTELREELTPKRVRKMPPAAPRPGLQMDAVLRAMDTGVGIVPTSMSAMPRPPPRMDAVPRPI